MKFKKHLWFLLILLLVLLVSFFVSNKPSNDRKWEKETEYNATAHLNNDGSFTIKNVRDFTYSAESVTSTDWIAEITLAPKNIMRVWFVLEPFAKWKAVGHTFLTFEFKDGSAYSFSVEARREQGEIYSAPEGLLNKYELIYTWGTERDFITRRLVYLNHPVKMYPLTLDQKEAQALFTDLLEQTNILAKHPRFYNTLTANCTNMLAKMANKIDPGIIPWDISWYLPGYSDRFLMRIGLIKTDDTFEQTQKEYELTSHRTDISKITTSPYIQFSKNLRTFLP